MTSRPFARRISRASHASTFAQQEAASEATFLFDRHGKVVGCSAAAAAMFDIAEITDIAIRGLGIWQLVPDLTPSADSAGFNARFIGYLARRGIWMRFFAQDTAGRAFPVDLRFVEADERDDGCYEMRVRRPGVT